MLYKNHPLVITEILERIGSFLFPPDLYSCVLVSRHWNTVLIPVLWRIIDDSLYSWKRLLAVYLGNYKLKLRALPPEDLPKIWEKRKVETTRWLYRVFEKYGRHIRFLHISGLIILNVARLARHCSYLRVLTVYHMPTWDRPVLTLKEYAHRQSGYITMNWANDYIATEKDWQEFFQQVDHVDKTTLSSLRSLGPEEEPCWMHWDYIQSFWILVLCNPNLEHLLATKITVTDVVTCGFVLNVLSKLPKLRSFSNRSAVLDLKQVLMRTSIARSSNYGGFSYFDWYCSYVPDNQLEKKYTHLTMLYVYSLVKPSQVLLFLKQLPNLDKLYLDYIFGYGTPEQSLFVDDDNDSQARSATFVLTQLHFRNYQPTESYYEHVMRALAKRIIPRLPSLVELTTEKLIPEMAESLVRHCTQFRAFRQGGSSQSVSNTVLNAISILLESCPNLKIMDANFHSIDAVYLLKSRWICENTLEILRCRIVGLSRPTLQEYQSLSMAKMTQNDAIYNTISSDTPSGPVAKYDEEEFIRHKYNQCMELHHQVYDRLAQLANLKVLDLGGYNKTNIYSSTFDKGNLPVVEINGRLYLTNSRPKEDCLELSLKSGLERLAPLRKLEEFGFEGLNHCIEEAELQWIAKSWPKLAVMSGIHGGGSLTLIKQDKRTGALRQYMQELRPDVVHEAPAPKCIVEQYTERLYFQ
ncbi:hypothetical protein FBU30_001870 [Linnemannia zychae]|nr:hypothetical protein FBU30_001870 [Linnemannia zychae]